MSGILESRQWRELPHEHRRWIIANAVVGTAILNLGLNASFAWLGAIRERTVPLMAIGNTSTLTDTVGTFFFLPLFTTLFCSAAVHAQQRSGRLAPLNGTGPWLERMRGRPLQRGLLLGAVTTLFLSPVVVPLLVVVDFGGISRSQFVLYKAVLGVVLGALVTPVIALRAMTDHTVAA